MSRALSIAPCTERYSACLWSDRLLLGWKVVWVEEGREAILALAHDPDRADHPARPPRPPFEESRHPTFLVEGRDRVGHASELLLCHVTLEARLDGIERVAERGRDQAGAARAKEASKLALDAEPLLYFPGDDGRRAKVASSKEALPAAGGEEAAEEGHHSVIAYYASACTKEPASVPLLLNHNQLHWCTQEA